MSSSDVGEARSTRAAKGSARETIDRLLHDLHHLRHTVFDMERRGDPPDRAEAALRRIVAEIEHLPPPPDGSP